MAQIEAKSWGVGATVPEGRCAVNLDDSALRMLEPAQHRKNSAQSSYHSFKYHFKPESIDIRKPGKVQTPNPPRAVDGVALDVELLGHNSEDKHLFTAVEQATKELDVFMIFDPTTGAFTMYEADSSIILSYDRAASKAASRSRSKTSPATQPLPIPTLPKPAPASTAPVRLPTTSTEPSIGPDSAKRSAVVPKTKKPKPKPVPLPKEPTPPPPSVQEEAEEGELELEPVSVPIPAQTDLMDIDDLSPTAEAEIEVGEIDVEPQGILPWDALPTTLQKRAAAKTSAFILTDPDEEVIEFGPSLGGARDPPAKKGQNKSSSTARPGVGGIVLPKAAPRQHQHREPPPRSVPVQPTIQSNMDLEDDEFEEIVPGVQDDLETEIMKAIDENESSDEEEDDGFDVQAFEQALAQEVPQDGDSDEDSDDDSDDDDDSSSEEEDD